jgi:hypothetical protein
MLLPHCTICPICSVLLVWGTSSGVPVAGTGDTGPVWVTLEMAWAVLSAESAALAEAVGKGRHHTAAVVPATTALASLVHVRPDKRCCMNPPPAEPALG